MVPISWAYSRREIIIYCLLSGQRSEIIKWYSGQIGKWKWEFKRQKIFLGIFLPLNKNNRIEKNALVHFSFSSLKWIAYLIFRNDSFLCQLRNYLFIYLFINFLKSFFERGPELRNVSRDYKTLLQLSGSDLGEEFCVRIKKKKEKKNYRSGNSFVVVGSVKTAANWQQSEFC